MARQRVLDAYISKLQFQTPKFHKGHLGNHSPPYGRGSGEGAAWCYFWGDKTSLISQSAVGRLEETRCLSLVVEEKSSLVNRSGIALLGKSYL